MGIIKDRERAEKERHRAAGKIVDAASLTGQPSGKSVWEEEPKKKKSKKVSKPKKKARKPAKKKAKKSAKKKAKKKG